MHKSINSYQLQLTREFFDLSEDDIAGEAGAEYLKGPMVGRMLTPQTAQATSFSWVAIRIDRSVDFFPLLETTVRETFLNLSAEDAASVRFFLEFTDKWELKIWNLDSDGRKGDKQLILFPFWGCISNMKDIIFCTAIRNQFSSPIPGNISLLRNLLVTFKKKNINYEMW